MAIKVVCVTGNPGKTEGFGLEKSPAQPSVHNPQHTRCWQPLALVKMHWHILKTKENILEFGLNTVCPHQRCVYSVLMLSLFVFPENSSHFLHQHCHHLVHMAILPFSDFIVKTSLCKWFTLWLVPCLYTSRQSELLSDISVEQGHNKLIKSQKYNSILIK